MFYQFTDDDLFVSFVKEPFENWIKDRVNSSEPMVDIVFCFFWFIQFFYLKIIDEFYVFISVFWFIEDFIDVAVLWSINSFLDFDPHWLFISFHFLGNNIIDLKQFVIYFVLSVANFQI